MTIVTKLLLNHRNKNKTVGFGQVQYISPGNYMWTVPTGVYEISAVAVGAGGANRGGGGDLRYVQQYSVNPGDVLEIRIPMLRSGSRVPNNQIQPTKIINVSKQEDVLVARSATNSFASTPIDLPNIGGGNGGLTGGSGGGGAGGYSGNGGNAPRNAAQPNSGGGGAGGTYRISDGLRGYGGGGVGILGEGSTGGASSGNGGSGPISSHSGRSGSGGINSTATNGGQYGGGGGLTATNSSTGGDGAVRIIWGEGRYYPDTNTHDM